MCSFGLKGTADPLLCQDPRTVLPSYASLMDTETSNDFGDNEVMTSNRLYSLYLLRGDAGPEKGKPVVKQEPNGKRKEQVNGEIRNGLEDALFEGMPFFELRAKEVGPCAYCNMWSPVRFMSYCGKFHFCSVCCTKKFAVYKKEAGELSELPPSKPEANGKMKVPTLFEDNRPKPLFPSNHQTSSPKGPVVPLKVCIPRCQPNATPPFDWSAYLEQEKAEAAPIRCFRHAPLNNEWKSSLLGAMLEVQTRDDLDHPDAFWVARIIQIAGYRARLRFEGYGIDSTRDFWIHLCTTESFPINGAVRVGKSLKPPKEVMERLGDSWLEHIRKVAHAGSLTISVPIDKVKQGLSCPFKKGMKLEAVYKRQLSHTCVARVTNVVADRIHVQYENCQEPNQDFWFHHSSPWIHPVGWSQRVGHRIIASAAFKSEALDKGRHKRSGPEDAPWEIFKMHPAVESHGFAKGMKMEVVDPLKLGNICAATVMEVLEEGHLMIAIDGCMDDKSSWFCYHVTSPLLLPVGFCEHHRIPIVPPRGFEARFDWVDYLKETQSIAAPVELFNQDIKDRGFRPGQKVEAVDLIEPGLICVASVAKTAGPLVSVHFDGWEGSFDQWVDSETSNIYPVGWCEMVGYPLQAPKLQSLPLTSPPHLGISSKSFKKHSRHSSSVKKRKLEAGGGKLSAAGLQCKTIGSKKVKDKFAVKKKMTPDLYWKQTGQDRVPSLDELEGMHRRKTTGGKDLAKVQTLMAKYECTPVKPPKVHPLVPVPVLTSKEKKRRLKKSKKEKRERRREKRKKEKKKSKEKAHRKKNKHRQTNGLSCKASISHKKHRLNKNSRELLMGVHTSEDNIDVVSTDRPLDVVSLPRPVRVVSPDRVKKVISQDRYIKVLSTPDRPVKLVSSPDKSMKVISSSHRQGKLVSTPTRSVKVVSTPGGPVKILTTPDKSIRVVSTPDKSLKVLSSPHRPVKVVTTPDKYVRVVSSPECKPSKVVSPSNRYIKVMSSGRPNKTLSSERSLKTVSVDTPGETMSSDKPTMSVSPGGPARTVTSERPAKTVSSERSAKTEQVDMPVKVEPPPVRMSKVHEAQAIAKKETITTKVENATPVISGGATLKSGKTTLKSEPVKLTAPKEARVSNVYFVSDSRPSRPKFESMFGDRQGFVFGKKKKACATKEKKLKQITDLDEHDPYSLEAEFPSVEKKETQKKKTKTKSSPSTVGEILRQNDRYQDSIKCSPPREGDIKGATTVVIPMTSAPSVLDSPVSLSSTQSTCSTGNVPPSSVSPATQRIDLQSLPTPTSSGEDVPMDEAPPEQPQSVQPQEISQSLQTQGSPQTQGTMRAAHELGRSLPVAHGQLQSVQAQEPLHSMMAGQPAQPRQTRGPLAPVQNYNPQSAQQLPQLLQTQEHAFDIGDVDDLMDIIEHDLASSSAATATLSHNSISSDLPRDIPMKSTASESEKDADRELEEILCAIRERGVQSEVEVAKKNDVAAPPKKKAKSRSKSVSEKSPAQSKKAAKTRKSQLASLLQRPGQINLASGGEVPFYMEGVSPPGLPISGTVPPPPPTQQKPELIDPSKKSSLLVEMLNTIPNCQDKPSPVPPSQVTKTPLVARLPSFNSNHLKRPNNLPFTQGPMSPPSYPAMSPSNQAAVLMELVRPPANPPSPLLPPQYQQTTRLPVSRSFPNAVPLEQLLQRPPATIPSQVLAQWVNQELVVSSGNPSNTLLAAQPQRIVSPQALSPQVPPNKAPFRFTGAEQQIVSPQALSPQVPPNKAPFRLPGAEQQIVSPQALSPQVPPNKAPFRFPGRLHSPSSTPQRLPPMQSLLRNLQSLLPKSPPTLPLTPSPAVGPISPQMGHPPSPYQPVPYQQQTSPGVPSPGVPSSPGVPPSPTERPVIPPPPGYQAPATNRKVTNPWHWTIPEVMQFLYDSGEAGCVDTFYRQQINGQKLMSLNKEQIAKLTGMKVASSIKLYQQLIKLRCMFPSP